MGTCLNIGLIGTGYVAKLRAEAIKTDQRCQLIGIAGHNLDRLTTLSQAYAIPAFTGWQDLLERSDLDLVIVATTNQQHGPIVRAALQQQKHVVVEYPLCLDLAEARQLLSLAKTQNRLLHVEHIELLGGLHQALLANLPEIGSPVFIHYTTLKAEHPTPQRWTYDLNAFGFPFIGALSRINRLLHAFGKVKTVSCQATFLPPIQFDGPNRLGYRDHPLQKNVATDSASHAQIQFDSCFCHSQLVFEKGALATLTYGKGRTIWKSERRLEVQGEQGALYFMQDAGMLITAEGEFAIEVGGRRGLFAKDTQQVLDHLVEGYPLYISPEQSLYALEVADATRRAAATHSTIML